MVTDEEFLKANSRAKKRTDGLFAVHASYDRQTGRIIISLSTGLDISFLPEMVEGLEHSTPTQLQSIEITPSGLGVHFSDIDADIYLPALLEGTLGSKSWMAARLGTVGGSVKTRAKAASSRKNGTLGGRPRKESPVPIKAK